MTFENYSLWDLLKKHDKPVILYGTGNGGDKILDVFENKGIELDAVFASDGFVRDRMFRGFKVESYSDIVNKIGNDIYVILAFGSNRPEVIDFITELDNRHTLIIPEVPLYGGELFDFDYFTAVKENLLKTASRLSDDKSVKVFSDAINFRLTGKLHYLTDAEDMKESLSDLFSDKIVSEIIDCGAFKGDTCEIFTDVFNPEKVYAIEADPKTFKKLTDYSTANTRTKVIPLNYVLSDVSEDAVFISSGSRGASEQGKNRRSSSVCVNSSTLDDLFESTRIDLIKFDIEGNEFKGIKGGEKIITVNKPALIVSLYHKTDDIIDLIEYVHSLLPDKHLYLRRVPCIPFWDLNLYAL